ncbi:hypothetical protein HQ560_04190 [bacterium]|nr:hypothetical protein [bacterium]
MKRFFLFLVVLALIAGGVYVYLNRDTLLGDLLGGGTLVVPIAVKEADGAGGIQFDVVYDSAALKPVSAKLGKRAKGSSFEHNLDRNGRVAIVIVNMQGIEGDGPVAEITFERVGKAQDTEVSLAALKVYHHKTLLPLAPAVGPGRCASAGAVTPITIDFAPQ